MNALCIYGTNLARALMGRAGGGSELQISLLAQALARNGTLVTVIDPKAGTRTRLADNLFLEGVPGWHRGSRGLRLLTHRIPNLLRSLRESGATVFYVRGFSYMFLLPLIASKLMKSTFVLAIASDPNLLGFRERYNLYYKKSLAVWQWVSTFIPNEIAVPFLIRSADCLLVQHGHQADLAKQRGKKALILRNIIDRETFSYSHTGTSKNIAIVGALSGRKHLNILLPIIKDLSSIAFEFIGDADDEEGLRVKAELARMPNVILHGWQNRENTLQRIADAKALLNVSEKEGFPNAFLEAWAIGTPVISLYVDPENLLQTYKCGRCCHGDLALMVQLLKKEEYDFDCEGIKQYLQQKHTIESALHVFDKIFGMKRQKAQ